MRILRVQVARHHKGVGWVFLLSRSWTVALLATALLWKYRIESSTPPCLENSGLSSPSCHKLGSVHRGLRDWVEYA